VNEDWGACGISLETGARVIGERARYERRCLELAETYKLTEREAEILALLGQDKTRAEIEAELFLSENTIKTHTRHIYQKTGAHSREEIISLIG
jgi:DNA-binding CsgD family transcriptional regulator